jgi:hypothetical protein
MTAGPDRRTGQGLCFASRTGTRGVLSRKTRDELTFVPLLQLLLVKVCRVLQLLELLLRQLGLAVITNTSAQLHRRACGLLCLGVGIQGLVFIGARDDAVAWWPWSRGRKRQTTTPRERRRGLPPTSPAARHTIASELQCHGERASRAAIACEAAAVTRRRESMGCATLRLLTIFPCLRRRQRPRRRWERRAIDGESTFPQEEKREVGGTLGSIGAGRGAE